MFQLRLQLTLSNRLFQSMFNGICCRCCYYYRVPKQRLLGSIEADFCNGVAALTAIAGLDCV
jgi:hypothetical protein